MDLFSESFSRSKETNKTPTIAAQIPSIFHKVKISDTLIPIQIALIAILILTETEVRATPLICELLPITTNREINKIPQIRAAINQFVSVHAFSFQVWPYRINPQRKAVT